MKSIWTVSNVFLILILFLSVVYLGYVFLMATFGSFFNAKPSGPDDFYVGVRTILNLLPWLLILSLVITTMLILVFQKHLFIVMLVSVLAVLIAIFFPSIGSVSEIKNKKEFLRLIQINDQNLKSLISEKIILDEQGQEGELLTQEIEDLIVKNDLGVSEILKYDSFLSIHGFVNQQGFVSTETKYIFVTPLLNRILFKNIPAEDLKHSGFVIKEWNRNLKNVPYLRIANVKDLTEGGILGLSMFLVYENTNFPTNKFVNTISLTPKKNYNNPNMNEFEFIPFVFSRYFVRSKFKFKEYLENIKYFVVRDSEKESFLSKHFFQN